MAGGNAYLPIRNEGRGVEMNKKIFLKLLRKRLSGLSRSEINDRIAFYSEMIDDRIEEGLSESDAISSIGSVDEIAKAVIEDAKTEKRLDKSPQSLTRVLLLICGFPVWFPLLLSLYAVLFSLFTVFLAFAVSLWSVTASLAVSAPAAILLGAFFTVTNRTVFGILLISSGVVFCGLAILLCVPSIYTTRAIPFAFKLLFKWTKLFFTGRRI